MLILVYDLSFYLKEADQFKLTSPRCYILTQLVNAARGH